MLMMSSISSHKLSQLNGYMNIIKTYSVVILEVSSPELCTKRKTDNEENTLVDSPVVITYSASNCTETINIHIVPYRLFTLK